MIISKTSCDTRVVRLVHVHGGGWEIFRFFVFSQSLYDVFYKIYSQWTSESRRTIALASHVMTNRSVLTRTLVRTSDAEIVRRTFLRTITAHPTGRTLALSVVRITRRPVFTLTVFGAEFAEFSGWTRCVEKNKKKNHTLSKRYAIILFLTISK